MASTSIRSTDQYSLVTSSALPLTRMEAPPLSEPSSTNVPSPSRRVDVESSTRQPVNHHHGTNTSTSNAGNHQPPSTTSLEGHDQDNEQGAASPTADSERLSSSSSSSSSSDPEPVEPTSKSQAFQRRPHFSSARAPSHQLDDGEADDDDEESPAFLPFSTPTPPLTIQDPSATLRIDTPVNPAQNRAVTQTTRPQRSQTAHSPASSASSAAAAASAAGTQVDGPPAQRPPGPLSPRRAAELSALSPRRRALAREGSDGTPSMGSSFSDLDGTAPSHPVYIPLYLVIVLL